MANQVVFKEVAFNLLGVEGRMFNRVQSDDTGLYLNQTFGASRPFKMAGYKAGSRISIELRFDDQCGNGAMSFSMTGSVREPGERDTSACGSIHKEIAKAFPELAHLIKWHGTDTRCPMHYTANALYHAGNRDHYGLLKGEEKQIINGRTGMPSWRLAFVNNAGEVIAKPPQYFDGVEPPAVDGHYAYVPWTRIGEGKERDLDAARRCAVWLDAPDDVLMLPREELRVILDARLPALQAEFRAAMDSCGFAWIEAIPRKTV